MNLDVNGLINEIKKHTGSNLPGILGNISSLTGGAISVDPEKLKNMKPDELIKTAKSFGIDPSKFMKK